MDILNSFAQRSRVTLLTLAATILFAAPLRPAVAAPYTWNGVSGAIWDLSNGNWTGASGNPWDAANGPTNAAIFNVATGTSAVVNGLVTTNNITFAPTTTGTFTITGGTIALAGGTSAQIMNLLSGGTTGLTAASTLTIASTITSTTNFFIGGFGTTILSGSNSLAGTVTIGSGTSQVSTPIVQLNNNDALAGAAAVVVIGGGSNTAVGQSLRLGNGITITGRTLTLSASTANGTNRASLQVATGASGTWNGNITGIGNGSMSLYADGLLTIGSGTDTTVTNVSIRGSGTGIMNSAITSLSKTDPGTWIINSASNTFATIPTISSGVVSIASIANAGVASPIGSGTTINVGNSSSGAVGNWGYLRVTSSTGGSSNRPIAIAGGTVGGSGGIDSAVPAGQLLTMSGNVTATGSSAFFVLTGSGNGLYTGNIIGTGTTIVGFYKTGLGTWTLSGSNSYSGSTFVNGGMLALGSTHALGTTGTVRFGGGTLQYGLNNAGDLSAKILGSGSAISIDTNGQSVTFASSLSSNNTAGLTKTGAGTLTLSASNAYLGTTTVNGGTLALGNPFALTTTTPTVVVNAGTLDLAGNALTLTSLSGTSAAGAITSSVAGPLTLTATSAGNTTYAGGINDGSATIALTKIGSGTLTLSGSSNYTGGTRLNGGAVLLGNVGALGTSGSISFSGGGLQFSSGNTVDYSSRILGSGSAIAIDTNGQSIEFASSLDASNIGGLTKSGAGLLTLSGTGTSLPVQFVSNGGTTVINPGANGSFSTTGRFYIGSLAGESTVTIASGAVVVSPTTGFIDLADSTTGTATLHFTGGTTTLGLGTTRMMVGNKGIGVVNVSGGSVQVTGGQAVYVGGDSQWTNSNANGTFTISGGTVAITSSGSFILAGSGTSGHTGIAGTLNLNGGEFQTIRAIATSTSTLTSTVNFNGGILKPLGSNATFLQGLTAAYVRDGGARIDTNGFDITIGQALLQGTGGSAGGLTKSGAGTLTLTGASTYTGATTVAGGTLAFSGGTNRVATATTLAFTGGTVALTAVSQTVAGLTVADSTSAAVVGIGASTIGVTNAIAFGGGVGPSTLLFQPLLSGSTADNLTVTATSGITVAAGGDLQLGAFGYTTGTFTNPNVFRTASGTTTPVTINGGSLTLTPMVTSGGQTTIGSAGAVNNQVGALTMTSGTISISMAVNSDRRLGAYGDVNITGGAIVNPTGNGGLIELFRYTNVLSPASPLPTGMSVSQYMPTTGTTATLAAGVGLRGGLYVRNGVGTLVLTSSATGANIGALQLGDNSATPGAGTTLKMGSDLTLVAGSALPTLHFTNTAEAGGRIDVGIDTDGYAFNLTGNTGVWQPSTSGTFQSYWQLSSSSGAGRFVTNGYNFVLTTATSNAFTSVGPNVVLESRSGNGVANNLGSSGTTGLVTIDPTSTFVYSGTAAIATPSTLTSARSIGNLEVAGSGALRLLAISGSVGNVGVSNGRLILGGTSIPVLPSVAVTGGTFDLNGYGATITDLTGSAGGTITSSSNTTTTLTVGGDNSTRFDGVLANSAGTLNFVKQGAGTLTLGGASTFTGTTTISAGSLVLDNALALENSTFDTAGSASLSFGTLTAASFGGLTGSGNIDLTALAGGLTIGGGNRSSTYGGVLSGAGGLTKTGTGTFILTGSQTYAGVTTISQGTLQVGNGGSTGWLSAGAVTNNATLAFSRSDNVTFSNAINGSGSVTQSGGGALTLSGSNGYTGGTLISGTGSLQVSNASQVGSGTITLRTTGATTATVLSLQNVTVNNPIELAQTASNRNNITVNSGAVTLGGPISITGTGGGVNVFQNSSTTPMNILGNITAVVSYTGALSFRSNTIAISGTINMPATGFDLNSGGTMILSSTGNLWSYTQFQASANTLRLGASNAMPTAASLAFSGNSTGGGLDLNGFNQTVPGFTSNSGTIPVPLARIFNSAATDSTLTLAALTADRTAAIALADGTGGGKVALVMNSVGRTQTLASSTSSYSGGTTIVAGTLAQGAANALGSTSGALAVNGGTLDLEGFALTVGTLSGSAGGVITSSTSGAVTFTASSNADSTFAGLIQNGLGTVGLTKAGSGALALTAAHTYTGPTNVNGGLLAVNGSLVSAVTVGASGEIGGAGSVGAISGGGLVGPGNSPGILTAPSVDPSGGLDFAFEFTQAAPNYASASSSDNDVLWLTGGTPFVSSLTGANTVSIYLTQSAAALSELTGGFFTAAAGDFFASISGASFQYFVQDAAGTFSYNGQAYKTLAQYDPSKSISVATVGANGGQVTQFVIVPEPGALVLAGVGIAAAAWAARRRRNS